jgi:membrane protease YdiL (CAAX protease family)
MIQAPHLVERRMSGLVLVAATLALAAKPWTAPGLIVVIAAGACALILGTGDTGRASLPVRAGIVGVGVLLFAAGTQTGPAVGSALSGFGVLSIAVAAIAEEALFRGALWSWISERRGPLMAAALTTVAFALIHIPTYGWAVLWIDLGAGAVFAWQRSVTGTWMVPAATHLFANLLQMG